METLERKKSNSKKISFDLPNYTEINEIIKNNGINMSHYINLGISILFHLYDANINYIESEELRKLRILAAQKNTEDFGGIAQIQDVMGHLVLQSLKLYLGLHETKCKDQTLFDIIKQKAKQEKKKPEEKILEILKSQLDKAEKSK